jgi:hypothetical protein
MKLLQLFRLYALVMRSCTPLMIGAYELDTFLLGHQKDTSTCSRHNMCSAKFLHVILDAGFK